MLRYTMMLYLRYLSLAMFFIFQVECVVASFGLFGLSYHWFGQIMGGVTYLVLYGAFWWLSYEGDGCVYMGVREEVIRNFWSEYYVE